MLLAQTAVESRIVLITGAGSGIGRELAHLFHRDGAHLIAASLVEDELSALREQLGGRRVSTKTIDLAREGAAEELFAFTQAPGLGVDTLVNNAGFGLFGEHLELDAERVTRMLVLNTLTPTRLCSLYGRQMRTLGRGRILNVASTTALQALPFLAAYAATKHYMVAFSEALHDELARAGVQVTTVLPGTTRTPFLDVAGLHASTGGVAGVAHRVAMSPHEVACAAYEGLLAGERRVIPGRLNKAHALVAELLPRAAMRRVAGRLFELMG